MDSELLLGSVIASYNIGGWPPLIVYEGGLEEKKANAAIK